MRAPFLIVLVAFTLACEPRISKEGNNIMVSFNDRRPQFVVRYPPIDIEEEQGPPPKPLLPGIVQGNRQHIAPGATATVLNLSAEGDKAAMVYTIAVYPLVGDVASMFDGALYSGGGAGVLNPNWFKFASPHRVKITYGIGGNSSQSVYCDLRRGIKLSVPLSSIRVDVTNINPATFGGGLTTPDDSSAFPTIPAFGFDVGASIAPGDEGTNNDGLSLTAVRKVVPSGASVFFPVPPHAKDYFVSVQRGSSPGGAIFNHAQFSDGSVVVTPNSAYLFADFAASGLPYGPFSLAGNITYIGIGNTSPFDEDFYLVWRLNL